MNKKILSILVAIITIVCSTFAMPTSAFASNVSKGSIDALYDDTTIYANSMDSDSSISSQKLKSNYTYGGKTYSGNTADVELALKNAMVGRNTNYGFTFASTDSTYANSDFGARNKTKQLMISLIYGACDDDISTSVYDGDYLMWNFAGVNQFTVSRDGSSGGVYFYSVNFYGIGYNTSANEEAMIDNWIKSYFSSFNMYDYSDYQLVKKFHDDICNMVVYDTAFIDTDRYDYSAYGVFYAGRTVCQGYSLAFYRLCREAGISCRIVTSGTQGNHAWNLVSMGGTYYYIDCTWDDGSDGKSFNYDFFLCGAYDITKKDYGTLTHTIDSIYDTDYYKSTYLQYTSNTNYNANSNNLCNATAYLSQISYDYTGTPYCPSAAAYMNGKYIDTTVSYINNVNSGAAYVRIYGTGDYNGMWIQRRFTIYPRTVLSYNFSLSQASFVYDGTQKRPSVYADGLTYGSDYTVSYASDMYAGIGYVTISGVGNTVGSVTLPYSIVPSAVSGVKVASSSTTSATLSWIAQPSVNNYIVSQNKGGQWVDVKTVPATDTSCSISSLTAGTSYDFAVRACDNESGAGAMSIVVGTCTKPKKVTIKSKTTKSKSITVKWAKTKCSGYQIQYSTSSKFSSKYTKSVKISGQSKVSKKITKLKKGKKYYIRVRAYKTRTLPSGTKKTYYGTWSSVKNIKCK